MHAALQGWELQRMSDTDRCWLLITADLVTLLGMRDRPAKVDLALGAVQAWVSQEQSSCLVCDRGARPRPSAFLLTYGPDTLRPRLTLPAFASYCDLRDDDDLRHDVMAALRRPAKKENRRADPRSLAQRAG